MPRLLIGKCSTPGMKPEILAGMFHFRFKIFHDKLGWDVPVENHQERDQFDDLNPVYLISLDQQNNTNGCWRLLPTVGSYMIKDTFPELARGESLPTRNNVWELSRFAVAAPRDNSECGQIALNLTTFHMMQKLIDFADKNDITAYVTAMSVSVERLMKRAGVPMQRFGDQKSSRVGRVRSVASWIPICEELRDVVAQATEETMPLVA